MLLRRCASRALALAASISIVAGACGPSDDPTPATTGGPPDATSEVIEAPPITPQPASATVASEVELRAASFVVRPSVNQLHVIGAAPGAALRLLGPAGMVLEGVADEQGSFLWRDIPGGEYSVETATDTTIQRSEVVTVTARDELPDASFYRDQVLADGFGYLTTRDGTTLSVNVSMPPGDGPFPTVVEYSGYAPSNPDGDGRSVPADLFTTLGYAHVGVNMRGTGCSGGSFEFFEPVQSTDGYDMIEVIAAQPWVLHGQVGMVGVSYPGISQLFVAQTRPPGLAAITPLSVLDDVTGSTLYPGGILNTGFALAWSDEREREAGAYGQGWEQARVDAGDTVCAENQRLRLQNTAARELIDENPFRVPKLADPLAPATFVDRIDVPVFLAGAWQDEQTGGHFPAMLDEFTGTPHLYATMVNGSHVESLVSLDIFQRYLEFLELYVARRAPRLDAAATVAPLLASAITGTSGLTLPDPDRYEGMTFDEALADYESQPPIRVLFEQGAAAGADPGAPLARFEAGFDSWPVPDSVPATWYLQPDGIMAADPVTVATADSAPTSYVADPDALPPVTHDPSTGSLWAAEVTYDWRPIPEGTGASWTTAPLRADTVALGFGSLDLWIRSSADDTDLEVTLSEVRPDGSEVYVQSGWLRASHRVLDQDESAETMPVQTHLRRDARPLDDVEFSLARVPIFPFAHPFREGSRVRVTVDAPGGARPLWAFATTVSDGETVQIAHDAEHRSKLVLSVVEGIDVPKRAPACGSLRSQPCRSGTAPATG